MADGRFGRLGKLSPKGRLVALAVVWLLAIAVIHGWRSQVSLPARSETRTSVTGNMVRRSDRTLVIKQVGDNVLIQVIGYPRPTRTYSPTGPCTTEALLPIARFRVFWDSLKLVGFWRLKRGYPGGGAKDLPSFSMSVSYRKWGWFGASKTVGYRADARIPRECDQARRLIWNMARFVRPMPDGTGDSP